MPCYGAFMFSWLAIYSEPKTLANGQLEMIQVGGLGACHCRDWRGAALVCFDFEYMTGFFHFCLYLVVTIGLRLIMGLPLMPGM